MGYYAKMTVMKIELCPDCKKKVAEYGRQRRLEKKALGMCAECRKPVQPGHTMCEYHLRYLRERMRILTSLE